MNTSKNTKQRALTFEELHFMLRSVSRIEAELRWLRDNDGQVAVAWKEAKRAGLSDTTAAEVALICLARENDDLRRQINGTQHAPAAPTLPHSINGDFDCPSCGGNLRLIANVGPNVRLSGRSIRSEEMRATIHEGNCGMCEAEIESVVTFDGRCLGVRGRTGPSSLSVLNRLSQQGPHFF